ncbi:hypothetical protein I8748_32360 [Nostoc sp. CENA67]|uniref:Uncharacterized protein n=1 Tax=Amazonocrinis nigriterrae CENA67 TaxID=2794033 RepID=A0A8J7I1W1_9NOST|nr:hypothetical protein [Amazonocrinis nigriterrae]MBH8566789.1 hypothetical protein [Amazonocrinis nigriterrae CENA67]
MSQELYFYKQKILKDNAAKILSEEEIYEAVKVLLAKRNLDNESSVRDRLFQEVELESLQISAYSPEIETLLEKDIQFINPQSRFFMMNKNMWIAIKFYIISHYIKVNDGSKLDTENSNEIDHLIKKLKQQNPEISHDYSKLNKLYNQKMLFINIQ